MNEEVVGHYTAPNTGKPGKFMASQTGRVVEAVCEAPSGKQLGARKTFWGRKKEAEENW